MEHKFLYIMDDSSEGTLLAQDGSVAIVWNNGKHLVAQCYGQRLEKKHIEVGFEHAFDEMVGNNSHSCIFDFKGDDEVNLHHIKEMAECLICSMKGEFFDNLTVIYVSEKQLHKKIKEFLCNAE